MTTEERRMYAGKTQLSVGIRDRHRQLRRVQRTLSGMRHGQRNDRLAREGAASFATWASSASSGAVTAVRCSVVTVETREIERTDS